MSQPSLEHRWLDGSEFFDWLLETCPGIQIDKELTLSQARALRRWREEDTYPDAYDIPDKVCVRVGLRIDDIPDSIWRKSPRNRGFPPKTWEQRKAHELYAEGFYKAEISRQLDVSVASVTRWLKDVDQVAA